MSEHDKKAKENKYLLELLENKKSLLKNILESIKTGIIIIDKSTIEWTNTALNEITGYKYEELIGKDFKKFFLNDDNKKIRRNIFRELLCNDAWFEGKWSKRKNGEVYLASTRFIPIEGEESERLSGLILIDDITSEEYYEGKIGRLTSIDNINDLYNKGFFEDIRPLGLNISDNYYCHS